METIKRLLNIELPAGQSAFLWGARKTGKTTYLRSAFPHSLVYDFLKTDVFFEFTKRPSLLREQLLAKDPKYLQEPIILDEVQKVPQILDEVHWLIENKGFRFILCGSSARKFKRGQANLLGGRAWRYEMFPLVTAELQNPELLKILNRGLIPSHYLQNQYRKSIDAYLKDYLKEEVFSEGLTRNIPAFSRFFEAMGYSHGELTNYSNIARDCGVDYKTVKEYYQILVDTLLGKMILPFKKRQHRQIISKAPKFYLFDVGIAGALIHRSLPVEKGELFGKALEHFIFMELVAHSALRELHYEINFWRTNLGMEIDFVLGDGEIAIEVKGTNRIENRDLRAMFAFIEDYSPKKTFVICNEREPRVFRNITILPWNIFLEQLWAGQIIF